MKITKISLLIGFFILVGCENMGELFPVYKSIPYKESFKDYVGQHYRQVEREAGPSDSISETSEGHKIFIYKYSRSVGNGVSCVTKYNQDKTTYQECSGRERVTNHCNVYYTTDDKLIVRAMDFRGQGCSQLIRVEVTDPEEIAQIRENRDDSRRFR